MGKMYRQALGWREVFWFTESDCMSVQAMGWVFENSESRLGPRHVLLSIANHADRYGRNAFPSVRTIAHEARLSPREVQYAIPILVDLGELLSQRGAGPGGANLYSLPKM